MDIPTALLKNYEVNSLKISIVEHDSNWAKMFETEKELLTNVFSDNLIRVEHFGSTSILNLSAKPIIDIFVFVHDTSNMNKYAIFMESHGYAFKGVQDLTKCTVFDKYRNESNTRTHKVNICEESNAFSVNALLFRDYLRINKVICSKYENLKKELAKKHYDDSTAYASGKLNFILEIIEEAKRHFA